MMNTEYEQIMGEINALKSLLNDTDYKSNQLIEGLVQAMKDATALNFITKFIAWLADAIKEYGEIVTTRECYRTRIRELEKELEAIEETTAETDAPYTDESVIDNNTEYAGVEDNTTEE